MTIAERFFELCLPADQCVVIGSGVLDALDLRPSADIDLVVSPLLFETLTRSGEWRHERRYGEEVLLKGSTEAWLSWTNGGVSNFTELYEGGVTIGGVVFANPRSVLNWKKTKGRQKDLDDVQLLEEYLKV